jgi:hypothetical protein
MMRLATFFAVADGKGAPAGTTGEESSVCVGDDRDILSSFSLSIAAHSAAVGTSWSDPESRLKMSVHLVDFLVLSSGVERAVVTVLTRDGVVWVTVTSTTIGDDEGREV